MTGRLVTLASTGVLAFLLAACSASTEVTPVHAPVAEPAPVVTAPAPQVEAARAVAAPALVASEFVNQAASMMGVPLQVPAPPDPYAPKPGGKLDLVSYRQTPWESLERGSYSREGSFIAETLVYFAVGPGTNPADYTVQPNLAESWEVSGDHLTYTFHLRHGVKFASQSNVQVDETVDVTAHDWVEMMEIAFGLPTSRFVAPFPELDGPQSWKAVDDYTLEVKLNRPSAAFLYKLARRGPPLFSVQPIRERMEREGLPLNEALKGWEVQVGTGPWVLTDWVGDVSNRYERNPNYWKTDGEGNQLPFIDQIEFFVMKDERAQDAGFRTGKIAAAAIDTCGLSTERYMDLNRSNPEIVWEIFVDPTNQRAVVPDYREGTPWQDVRVRRAMQLAIDKEGWVSSVLGGWGLPYSTPLAPGNQYWLPPGQYGDYDGDGVPGERYLEHDVDAARQLMAEAGYADGIKGRFLLTHDLGNRFFSEGELIVEALRKIGIDMTIEVKDGAARRSARSAGDFDLVYTFPGYGWDPSDWFLRGYSSQNNADTYGPAGLVDPVLDRMIEEEERTLDPARRWQLVADLQRYLQEKQYYTMSTNWIQIVGIQPWLKNYQYHYISPIGPSFAIAWIDR